MKVLPVLRKTTLSAIAIAACATFSSCAKHTVIEDYEQTKEAVTKVNSDTQTTEGGYVLSYRPINNINKFTKDLGLLPENKNIVQVPSVRFDDENQIQNYICYNSQLNSNPDTVKLVRYKIFPDYTGNVDTLKVYNANNKMVVESKNDKLSLNPGENGVWEESKDNKVVAQWYNYDLNSFIRKSADGDNKYVAKGIYSVPLTIDIDTDVEPSGDDIHIKP